MINFAEAAKRHFHSARELEPKEALQGTTDHLLGLSVECALKAILVLLKVGEIKDQYLQVNGKRSKGHVDKYIGEYNNSIKNANFEYGDTSSWDDWKVDQRYAADQDFTPEKLKRRFDSSLKAMKLLESAENNNGVK